MSGGRRFSQFRRLSMVGCFPSPSHYSGIAQVSNRIRSDRIVVGKDQRRTGSRWDGETPAGTACAGIVGISAAIQPRLLALPAGSPQLARLAGSSFPISVAALESLR